MPPLARYAGIKGCTSWINLGLAFSLYVPWYLGGTLTWLARPDTEGADVGWMSHGVFVTLPCGPLAVVLF